MYSTSHFRITSSLFIVWALLSLVFVAAEDPEGIRELRVFTPAAPTVAVSEEPLFQSLTPEESGLDLVIPIDTSHPDKRLYYSAMACGSVAAGDLDGDGWSDLFFAAGPVPNRLYRNRAGDPGPLFEDVSEKAGIADPDGWGTGAVLADIDGDGDLDIYVCRYDAPNLLFLNDSQPGEFRFHEAAAEWGLDLVDASLMAQFVDYDGDGLLDVFLVTNSLYNKGGRPAEGVPMRRVEGGWEVLEPWDRYFGFSSIDPVSGQPTFTEIGRPNRLLRNEGGKFRDVSVEAGILRRPSHSNGAVWFDRDGDGFLDLYVANDFSDRDEFYHNRGDGTFEEMAAEVFQHTAWFSMGGAAEDFNGDGRSDLIIADMLPTTHYRQKATMGEMGAAFAEMYAAGLPRQNMVNTYFINTGTGFFFEAARLSGLAKSDWTWTVKSGDLDGDGRVDLYFTTGHSRDFNHSDFHKPTPDERVGRDEWSFYEDKPELREHDLAFRNVTEWKFEKAGEKWGLGRKETMTFGAGLADFDRDGDLDMVTVSLEDAPVFHRNLTAERGTARHVLLRLKGAGKNRYGIGTRVRLETASGQTQTRVLTPWNGYQESDEPLVHFGLGEEDQIASLELRWPGGTRQTFRDLKANRWLEISETEGKQSAPPEKPAITSWFRAVPEFTALASPETPFDDFERQPLLPHQHSRLGPGQAWGDVDGDGAPDLYLGGAKGHPGRLLLNRGTDSAGNPTFALRMRPPFTEMRNYEDLGALLLDVDGDGDRDLLAVGGSVEGEPGAAFLADRLYLNDGTGDFTAVEDHLPDPGPGDYISGGAAAAADFDRNGSLDVFIGGRVVPGEYPVAARNRLLINDGTGHFTDRAEEFGLIETGMVTAALWSDIDSDGWPDLLVTHEWGPVRVFSNREGRLVEVTEKAGLAKATGFWNSIAGRDLTGNGHIDFVVGNLGRNTKYSASAKAPELLFYGDVGGNGKKNLVEAKPDESLDGLLPRRGLSCSSLAMPSLLKRIDTYHEWASSELGEIYDSTRLDRALRLEATTLESMVMINDGEGGFTLHPLPTLAQLAPVFGIGLADFDGDGHCDVALAQNFFSTQEETGPYDGGMSLLLRGSSNGIDGLSEVWPLQSGIVVPGDSQSLGVADIDGDDRPDLCFGVNEAPSALFLNQTEKGNGGAPLVIELHGPKGNPDAIGARITVEVPGLKKQTAEMSAGSGYLSQSEPALYFGWGEQSDKRTDPDEAQVTIQWPDGETTVQTLARNAGPRYRISAK